MKKFLIAIALVVSSFYSFGQETVKTEKIKASHRTIYTDIIIDATPEQVWTVLTDTENYDWSVFMTNIDGKICDQCEIDAYFQMNSKKEKITKIHHTISVVDGKEFKWNEVFGFGILDNHRFIVESTADGKTKFIQSDECKGGLTWLLGKKVITIEEENYPRFNKALKAEVEKRYQK